jgi:Mg2+ and Co2+ transporter CorA
MSQGAPGSSEMLEQLYNDVQDIRRAIQDARANVRNRAFTSEAACDVALTRLHDLEKRFPELKTLLQRRENARKKATQDERIARLEKQLHDLNKTVQALTDGRVVPFRERDAG